MENLTTPNFFMKICFKIQSCFKNFIVFYRKNLYLELDAKTSVVFLK